MSNRNLDRLFRNMINESCNGLYLESFEDKMILADSNTGSLYMTDYNFDGQKLKLENFEEIVITNDESRLQEAISDYLDDRDGVGAIVEAYENDKEAENTDLHDSIVESLATKKADCPDYTQLVGINESLGKLQETNLFKQYTLRLQEKPLTEAKVFDWVKPVEISLIDEDENKTIIRNVKAKCENLIKDKEFKNIFAEGLNDLFNGDNETIKTIIESNQSILALDDTAMKEFIGLVSIGNKDLMSNRKSLSESVFNMISEDENLSLIKDLMAESEDDDSEDKNLQVSDKDIETLKDALDKALENITDEKLVSKINSLKDALEADTAETDVGTVKECVSLLSL